MKPQIITQCDAPHPFEPLLPAESAMGPMLEQASDLSRAATALGTAAGQTAQLERRKLLHSMRDRIQAALGRTDFKTMNGLLLGPGLDWVRGMRGMRGVAGHVGQHQRLIFKRFFGIQRFICLTSKLYFYTNRRDCCPADLRLGLKLAANHRANDSAPAGIFRRNTHSKLSPPIKRQRHI